MDEPIQRDSRFHAGGDCSAAECPEQEELRGDRTSIDIRPAEPEVSVAPRPLAWQCDRRLLLLDREAGTWVLAELEFEPEICRYRELRRAFYQWEREAVGAFLSRTVGYGMDAAQESAELLEVWLRRHRPESG